MAKYAAALDQGTTSTRCMIFDHGGKVVASPRRSTSRSIPKPGWVEHDANEIWARTQEVDRGGDVEAGASADDIAGVGITNQRETTLVWDSNTGEPVHNALVWQDTRTDRLVDEFSQATAARPASRSRSGCRWPPTSRARRSAGSSTTSTARATRPRPATCVFGNMDTWLIWNLTGGTDGGLHITDVTNASRTMLMDLKTLPGTTTSPASWAFPPRCCRRSRPRARSTARSRPAARSRASRSPATSATSRRRRSARPASRSARPRTPTARATSCCSTRAPRRCSRRAAC